MKDISVSQDIIYIGAYDRDIDLFESQYPVPDGVTYNSYVIMDEKIAVMDTADRRASGEWFANLEAALGGRSPDYLVSLHLEPDHSGNIQAFADKYPEARIVVSAKAALILPQFCGIDMSRVISMKEGDKLSLGVHELTFVMAPMVHWPEVMMAYESRDKVLFSADGFGRFGSADPDEDWDDEARRYYFNIVGKYGAQVQAVLKKAAGLDIAVICPLHGPVLKGDLGHYIGKYQLWSSYAPEDDGVFVAYASIHGHTAAAVRRFVEILEQKGAKKVVAMDLARCDMSEAVENAFRYDKIVFASVTYDASLFPAMEDLLYHLKIKAWRGRKAGLIENGSWAPSSAKLMRAYLEGMKDIEIVAPEVTIRTAMKPADEEAMAALADALLA